MTQRENTAPQSRLFNYYEKYMTVVGTAGQALFFFQAYKIFTNHSASDVSFHGFLAGLVSVTSWLIYGIWIKNTPLIMANLAACIGALLVIVGIVMYG